MHFLKDFKRKRDNMYDEYTMRQYAEYSKKLRQLNLFGWARARGLLDKDDISLSLSYPPKTEEK